MTPKISVICPVYNTSKYLVECIESIISQTFADWELLMVDDGSTDNSVDIIQDFIKKDSRIKILESRAGCVSVARNLGLSNAQGEYVYFVDSDDYMTSTSLEILINEAFYHPEVDFFQGSFIVDNQIQGTITKASRFTRLSEIENKVLTGHDYFKFCGWTITYPWNSLIKREFLIQNNIKFPPEITHMEDLIFIQNILLANSLCEFVDNQGIVYRYGRVGSLSLGNEKNTINATKKKLITAIIRCTKILQSIHTGDKVIDQMINNKIIDNVTGCIGGASLLLPDREVFEFLKRTIPRVEIKYVSLRSALALIYNISPNLALKIRKILN